MAIIDTTHRHVYIFQEGYILDAIQSSVTDIVFA